MKPLKTNLIPKIVKNTYSINKDVESLYEKAFLKRDRVETIAVRDERYVQGNFTAVFDFFMNKTRNWYKNGVKHREDGPAVIHFMYDKPNEYWYLGNQIKVENDKEYKNYIKSIVGKHNENYKCENLPPIIVIDTIDYLPINYTGIASAFDSKSLIWCKNGKIHNEEGPAIIRFGKNKNFKKEYWLDNKRVKNCNNAKIKRLAGLKNFW